MADKKITPKAAASKDKQSGDRAAARVSLKRTAKTTSQEDPKKTARRRSDLHTSAHRAGAPGSPPFCVPGLACPAVRR